MAMRTRVSSHRIALSAAHEGRGEPKESDWLTAMLASDDGTVKRDLERLWRLGG